MRTKRQVLDALNATFFSHVTSAMTNIILACCCAAVLHKNDTCEEQLIFMD